MSSTNLASTNLAHDLPDPHKLHKLQDPHDLHSIYMIYSRSTGSTHDLHDQHLHDLHDQPKYGDKNLMYDNIQEVRNKCYE